MIVPARCPVCGSERGPWEAPPAETCFSCQGSGESLYALYGAEGRVAVVLERSSGPLHPWDIQRLIPASPGGRPAITTINQTLCQARFCWAGRSLYGLYRHGILPGARSLAEAAGVVIHVAARPVSGADVHFALRFMGYRYAAGSMNQALNRVWTDGVVKAYTDGTYAGDSQSPREQRRVARSLGFPRRGDAFYAVTARAATQVADALVERERRLG